MSEQSRGHRDKRQAEPALPPVSLDDTSGSSIRQLQPSARSMIEAELPLKRRDKNPPLQGHEASVQLTSRQHRRIPSEDGEVSDVDQPPDSCATHNELDRDPTDPNSPFFSPRNPLRRWGPDPDLADFYQESGGETQLQVAQAQRCDEDESFTDSQPAPLLSSQQQTDSPEYLEWKANGRPTCKNCLKAHPGPCRLSQWESDFLQRDPEGYARYRKSLKKPRHRRKPLGYSQRQGVRKNTSRPKDDVRPHNGPPTAYESPWAHEQASKAINKISSRSEFDDIRRMMDANPKMESWRHILTQAEERFALTTSNQGTDIPAERVSNDSTTASQSPADARWAEASTTADPSVDLHGNDASDKAAGQQPEKR